MIELTLPTMNCNNCARAVTEAVRRLDSQAELSFDLPNHVVRIETTRSADELRRVLAEEGYASTP